MGTNIVDFEAELAKKQIKEMGAEEFEDFTDEELEMMLEVILEAERESLEQQIFIDVANDEHGLEMLVDSDDFLSFDEMLELELEQDFDLLELNFEQDYDY